MMNTTKPKFIRHFLRKLVPCLISAVLVGAVCTAGLYAVRTQSICMSGNELYQSLSNELRKKNLNELEPDEISFLLARRASNYDKPENVDCAIQLKRLDKDDTYDSSQICWALCNIVGNKVNYYSSDPALLELMNTPSKFTLKSGYFLRVQDVYVKDNTFHAGKVDLMRESETVEAVESYDLTPADTEGYQHIYRSDTPDFSTNTDSLVICAALGTKPNSHAMETVHTMGDNENGHAYIISLPGEPLQMKNNGKEYLFLETPQVHNEDSGIPCLIKMVVYYHFWAEQKWVLLIGCTILLLLSCITAAILGIFSFQKACKVCEIEEYRRNLTNALAHDLKSPLTAMAGYAENLRSGIRKEKQDYYADAIFQNTQYMDRMIADVLELSKLEGTQSVEKSETDAAKLLYDAFSQYQPALAERHITLTCTGDCTVTANEKILSQAMGNLASNAVRFTPNGGKICIQAAQGCIKLINDCAESIPDAPTAPFTKGEAARSEHSGSGLGLSIVQQIMTLHGFGFTVQSADSKFTAEMRFGASQKPSH